MSQSGRAERRSGGGGLFKRVMGKLMSGGQMVGWWWEGWGVGGTCTPGPSDSSSSMKFLRRAHRSSVWERGGDVRRSNARCRRAPPATAPKLKRAP